MRFRLVSDTNEWYWIHIWIEVHYNQIVLSPAPVNVSPSYLKSIQGTRSEEPREHYMISVLNMLRHGINQKQEKNMK